MAIHTGEDPHVLKKIIDLTRLMSLALLLLHCYYFCFRAFEAWHLTSNLSNHVLKNLSHSWLLENLVTSKFIALIFLLLSVAGVRGRKNQKLDYRNAIAWLLAGLVLYFSSHTFLLFSSTGPGTTAIVYIGITITGYLMVIKGAGMLGRILKSKLNQDIFNTSNESFPQEERLLNNEYSINLPAKYNLKGKIRNSWINIINPMRGLLVVGSPGAGKSYFVVEHVIKQHIEKGFSMFIYDYKYDDLTRLAYNHYLKHRSSYHIPPSFYVINIDNPSYSHRCNPIDPAIMNDITDAVEAARVILLGLNRSWLKKQGEFFVESPINFLTALIWFLRKYEDGAYCTLPHAIELMQVKMDDLFTILRTEPEIHAYINPFISAFTNNAMEQLEGQLDAAKIGIARLSSPSVYYILSGNDLTLDINNPQSPKILCLANNPQKQEVYGPILSLYITRMTKIINRKNQLKSSLVLDEFSTLTFLGFDTLIATGRSNKISTTLAVQDASQLKLNYGKELADVIVNICGNLVVGQVGGEIAKQVSERLGKTLQDRETITVNSGDTSISRSKQLETAVPVSTIATLSAGEIVGMVADNPDQPITLKTFHSQVINDHDLLKNEKNAWLPMPIVRKVDRTEINAVYDIIRQDVKDMVESMMDMILNDEAMRHLIVKK